MQLKKIELQGFKSFADKTEIVFLDGIATIVGPNGSGKSNISDAIRWVLGEQSVKTLRGSKMEDIIFAGTIARKKVGFAEVSMYLDNTDQSLPVEYSEVVVTRRIYRTGESNYLLNGSECRLKDIQELFMDTGIGKDGYSIISQGKIDEILSAKSDERRHIFEEASGIVKYRTRKDEAKRKLDNTETTLSRVRDILTEIENIIEPLEKKSTVAKKYLNLRDELKLLDVHLFVENLNKNAVNLSNLDDIIETFTNDIAFEEKISLSLEKAKVNVKETLQEIMQKIETTQAKYFELENEAEKSNSKLNLAANQIQNANEVIVRLEEEIKEDNDKILILEEEKVLRDEKQESLSKNKVKFETELKEKQSELEKLLGKLDEQGKEIEEIKLEIDRKSEEKYELKIDIGSMETRVEELAKQLEEKKKNSDRSTIQKDSLSASKSEYQAQLDIRQKKLRLFEENISSVLSDIDKNKQYIDSVATTEEKLKQECLSLKSKYTYLVNLEHENEGYQKSVKYALDYAKTNNLNSVYGTLASNISTEEKYEHAIEIAMGGYTQNIITQDDNTAKKIIEHLKQNAFGRATFLPLDSIKEIRNDVSVKLSRENGFIGMATDIVKFDEKYKKVVNLALGNTVIVDGIENALAMYKKKLANVRIVTLAGDLIAPTGSMTGGKSAHKSLGLIGRSEKIAKLKSQIEKKEKEFNDFTKGLVEARIKVEEYSVNLNNLRKDKGELDIEMATLQEKYDTLKKEEEKIKISKEATKKYIEELENELVSIENSIKEANNSIIIIDEYINTKQVDISEYTRFNKEKMTQVDYLNEDVVNLRISLSSFDDSVASIDEMKEKIASDISSFNISINRKNEQIQEFLKVIEDNKKTILEIEQSSKEQSNFKEEYLLITQNLKKEKEEMSQKQEELEIKVFESIKKIEKLKDERAKIESRKIKYDIEIENLKNTMWEDYEITISGAKQLIESSKIEDISHSDMTKKADKLRKEIKSLGEISVSSIEEYQKTKERYDFIIAQKSDLEETKDKLQSLINNMTSIMKQQFAKQFKIITENFNETFKELFGGGKADLRLADESNILESGIEIEVQPPGKKLQNMMLLSGGERALTATALLFAILKIKTPPFCVLDEIEAALDDVNVHRFSEYIKKYSKNTQFIVITHRKGTMEVASAVYGVTMEEYGISKIISMKLKQAK